MNTIANMSTAAATRSQPADTFYRIGYACHGAIHLLIGYLALSLALGEGGRITGAKGALSTVADQPFGKFILLLLGVGTLGYVAWQFARAFGNLDREGHGSKALFKRLAHAGSGLVYLSVAYFAIRAFMDGAAGSEGGRSVSAQILGLPAGEFLLMAIGVGIIMTGVTQIIKGVTEKFFKETNSRAMSANERKLLLYSGKIGLPARGVTLAIIGYLFVKTGIEHQARDTGTKGALELLTNQPYGTTVLAIISAGFIAYAVYCFIAARHQRFVN